MSRIPGFSTRDSIGIFSGFFYISIIRSRFPWFRNVRDFSLRIFRNFFEVFKFRSLCRDFEILQIFRSSRDPEKIPSRSQLWLLELYLRNKSRKRICFRIKRWLRELKRSWSEFSVNFRECFFDFGGFESQSELRPRWSFVRSKKVHRELFDIFGLFF